MLHPRTHPRRVLLLDVSLALLAAAVGVAQLLAGPVSSDAGGLRAGDALGVGLILVMVLPVAVRRVAPRGAVVIAGIAALATVALDYGFTVGALIVWLLLGSTALHTDRRTSAALAATGAVSVAWSVSIFDPGDRRVLQLAIAAAVGAIPVLFGDALRRQRELTDELTRLRAAELDRAVAAERVRIARDVHDTVGHHLGAIGLLARAAELDHDPRALARIAELSDRALSDTRQTLGVLRAGDPAGRAPVPRLTDLPELVRNARAAGLDLDVRTTEDLHEVPDVVSTCAYRITQEALTNAARHAAPTRAELRIERDVGRVRLSVRDHGTRRPATAPGAAGIAGMRERAESLGGRFSAEPATGGGWRVIADLPERP